MQQAELVATRCAICGTTGNASQLYPETFRPGDLNPAVFSARRSSDRLHYRIVRCRECGLVRSDPIASPKVLAELYADSAFAYDEELDNLQHTYGSYLTKLAGYCGPQPSLLEIGCGNGFALEEARRRGFSTVRGVEPSTAAVARATPQIAPNIARSMMRPGLWDPEEFDAVCLFQVFDHLPDPGGVLDQCWTVLRPGGHLLLLNHNVVALSARLLRRRSPIIDIEHTDLFSPGTLARSSTVHGFEVQEAGPVWNRTRLSYLARLAPLPSPLQKAILKLGAATGLDRVSLTLPLGNQYLIAAKRP